MTETPMTDRTPEEKWSTYDELVEVTEDDAGALTIPGAAGVEDRATVTIELELRDVVDRGQLKGWGAWERHFADTDIDGGERHYFARSGLA